MKTQITLDTKEVRLIIAKFLNIKEEQVIPMRYNYAVEGLTAERITKLLNDSANTAG